MSKEALKLALEQPVQEFLCSTGLCHYKPAAQPVAWVDIREIDIMAEAKHWRNPEAFINGAKWAQVELKGKNT